MKDKIKPAVNHTSPETIGDLKKQSTSIKVVKKGYNEKNPVQPQGAFKPDNSSNKN